MGALGLMPLVAFSAHDSQTINHNNMSEPRTYESITHEEVSRWRLQAIRLNGPAVYQLEQFGDNQLRWESITVKQKDNWCKIYLAHTHQNDFPGPQEPDEYELAEDTAETQLTEDNPHPNPECACFSSDNPIYLSDCPARAKHAPMLSKAISGKSEYNQMNDYKPCPKCGEPVFQGAENDPSIPLPYCSYVCAGDAHNDENLNFSDYTFADKLDHVLQELGDMLLEKNKAYGDSALKPINIFSKGEPAALIRVRIDDKLTRIKNLGDTGGDTEDAVSDLIGYLILLQISKLQ